MSDAGAIDAGMVADAGPIAIDAGSDGGTSTPAPPEGCGCSTDGGGLMLLALLIFAWMQRARST